VSTPTRIVGFKSPEYKHQIMTRAWDACHTAGIPVPDTVERYFGGNPPHPSGVEVDIPFRELDGTTGGYEVAVSDIPADVTAIRFYNSH
jgi:hypothetical protein